MNGHASQRRKLSGALGVGLLLLLLPGCLFIPERGFIGEPVQNDRPFCHITGGVLIDTVNPDSAENVDARVHFFWFGGDNDGMIRYFEWAIDDTLSEDAWHQTDGYDEVISFRASHRTAGRDFADWHTFFLRSVDDDFARSHPDRRFFNAHTIAPETEIQVPADHRSANLQWARTLRVVWEGEDLDASQADRTPVWFEYKWVQIAESFDRTDLPGLRRLFDKLPNEFLRDSLRAADFPAGHPEYLEEAMRQWIRVPGSVNEVWLENMVIDTRYGFVVRAVDEAGAVEPDLDWDNWTIFAARDQNIIVTLSEPSLGWHLFTAPEYETWDVAIAPKQRFRFQWTGDASNAGTDPGPTNYGFDIPDPNDDGYKALDAMGGWIGWAARSRMDRAVSFPRSDEGLTHHFYLKMRDISGVQGTETRAHVALRVVRFSFHKKFLLVDDIWGRTTDGGYPQSCGEYSPPDTEMDAWHEDMFMAMRDYLAETDEPDHFALFGEGDSRTSVPQDMDYADLFGRYQTLIWSSADPGVSNGLLTTARSGDLAHYIGAGGNLILLCHEGPVTAITQDFNVDSNGPKCPTTTLSLGEAWNPYSLLYQQFHLRDCVDKPRGSTLPIWWHIFRKQTLIGARAESPIYPDLDLNWERWNCTETLFPGGVIQYEALWPDVNDPLLTPWYEKEAGMELLYRAKTYEAGSRLDDLPIAWRTSATAEDRAADITPGRVVVFAFHPYFFEREAVKSAMTLALQWTVTGSDF